MRDFQISPRLKIILTYTIAELKLSWVAVIDTIHSFELLFLCGEWLKVQRYRIKLAYISPVDLSVSKSFFVAQSEAGFN